MESNWHELKRLASRCKLENKLPEAVDYLERASDIAMRTSPGDAALLFNSLADLYLELGHLSSAEKAARISLTVELEFGVTAQRANRLGSYHVMLARVLEQQQRFRDAVDCAEKAIEIFTHEIGTDDEYVQKISKYRDFLKENTWRG